MSKITICPYHQEYKVPLISTMVFVGAELWCPYCENTEDMFGGEEVEATREIVNRGLYFRVKTKKYLDARYEVRAPITESSRQISENIIASYKRNVEVEHCDDFNRTVCDESCLIEQVLDGHMESAHRIDMKLNEPNTYSHVKNAMKEYSDSRTFHARGKVSCHEIIQKTFVGRKIIIDGETVLVDRLEFDGENIDVYEKTGNRSAVPYTIGMWQGVAFVD